MRVCWYIEGKMKRKFKIRTLVSNPYFPPAVELYRWDHLGRDKNKTLVYNKLEILEGLNRVAERHFSKGLDCNIEDTKQDEKLRQQGAKDEANNIHNNRGQYRQYFNMVVIPRIH